MDRQIIYVDQCPEDTDLLLTNKNTMVALGYLMQALLGTSTLVDGLACGPTSPATMSVQVGAGSIMSLQEIDATAYGSISADTTDQIVKQGIIGSTQTFSCPAPGTSGQSVVYLVEAAYQDVDTGSTVLPYYNASNPSQAYAGPNNTGISQATIRQGLCKIQVKTGVAATTGTQVTPTPDAGFTGLYAITVANGASTITSGNIVQLATAPFIGPKLPNVISTVQSGGPSYAVDTSSTPGTITANLSPVPTSQPSGMPFFIKVANANPSAVTLVLNTTSYAVQRPDGSALTGNEFVPNVIYPFVINGSVATLHAATGRKRLSANTTFYVASTGSDTANTGLSSGSPWLTIQKAINYIANSVDLAGFTATISVADGTYTGAVNVNGPWTGEGAVNLVGDTATPANCIISTTSANCITGQNGGVIGVSGFRLKTATSGYCLVAQNGTINVNGVVDFNTVASGYSHMASLNVGYINLTSNYSITAGAQNHMFASAGGTMVTNAAITVTLTGTPAFTAYAATSSNGSLGVGNFTFSGSATGSRYSAVSNGSISSNGGGASYFPGNSIGTTATGGQYV